MGDAGKHETEHRLADLLQDAIFGPVSDYSPHAAEPLTPDGLRQAIEKVAENSSLGPYDHWPGSEINPVHPADAEAARVWHGLPEGATVTRQQYWEWLVGVPRT